jgi:hypothetical protein
MPTPPPSTQRKASSYVSYPVHQQSKAPTILRDADATQKLLEVILEMPSGRKSLARLARTCKAFKEPALNLLWRDLWSVVPLVGLFPPHLLKKPRKPGMGFVSPSVSQHNPNPNFYRSSKLLEKTTGKQCFSTASACMPSLTMRL